MSKVERGIIIYGIDDEINQIEESIYKFNGGNDDIYVTLHYL